MLIMNKKTKSRTRSGSLHSKSYDAEQNKVKKNGQFTSKRKWYDYQGIFFYIPTIMKEENIDLNVDTTVTRTIIAFGYRRWSFDKGIYNPFKEQKIWKKEGLEDFLNWCKLKTKNRWSVQDIELVFKENEGLKTLVYSVGLKKHYIKLLLLKEMIEMRNNTDINDDDPTILKQEKLRMSQNKGEISDVLNKFHDIFEK